MAQTKSLINPTAEELEGYFNGRSLPDGMAQHIFRTNVCIVDAWTPFLNDNSALLYIVDHSKQQWRGFLRCVIKLEAQHPPSPNDPAGSIGPGTYVRWFDMPESIGEMIKVSDGTDNSANR